MYLALIKHLVSVVPGCLEQKSSEGWTPLQVAVLAHQPEVISYLLSEGADQRSRDKAGRNVIHSMVCPNQPGRANTNPNKLKQLISLFDKSALQKMFLERCTERPGALTPLAYWMASNNGSYKKADVVEILAEHSNGEDLAMINGEGDLPLHVAIAHGMSTITSFLLSRNPSLLYRENATGRTPLEASREICIASQVGRPMDLRDDTLSDFIPGPHDRRALVNKPSGDFIVTEGEPEESTKRTWEICGAVDAEVARGGEEKRKRRLVSLFEANEVAQRVANLKTGPGGRQLVVNGGLVDGEGKPDVVSKWMANI